VKYIIGALIILASLLVLQSASAFTLSAYDINRSVYEGQKLNYTVEITNDKNITDTVSYFDLVSISSFRVSYVPISRVLLAAGETKNVTILISSTDNTPLAIEVPFKIYFSSLVDNNQELVLRGRFDKLPSDIPKRPVITKIEIAESLDPRDEQAIIATIYNPSDSLVESFINYSVKKDTEIVLNNNITTLLEPLAFSQIEIPVDLFYYQEPGNYTFTIRAYNQNYSLPANFSVFQVGGFSEFNVSDLSSSSIFGKTIRVRFTNEGTAIGSSTRVVSLTPLQRLLNYATEGEVTYANGALTLYTLLLPGQSKDVVYKVTYIPLLISPFVLLGLVVAFKHFTRKMDVSRAVTETTMTNEEFSFKVVLRVKNVSQDKLKNIRVREKLLPFAKTVGSYGTLHPKMIKDSTGKKLLWEINELGPGDEAVISYRIRTSVGILGKIILPATLITAKFRGRTARAKTQLFVITPEE